MRASGAILTAQVADTAVARQEGLPLVLPGLTAETQAKIVLSVVLVLLLVLGRRALLRIVDRKVEDGALRYRWSKSSAYTAFVLGLFLVVPVWMNAIRSVGTFLGLLSAGLAIALKDLVADLAGWVFIRRRRPFDLGDRIQLGEHSGDVVDIRIFAFTIMEIGNWVAADQSTGRMIHLPNASVFTLPLANYTAGFPFLWNELPVLVTFESDWRRASKLLTDVVFEETRGVSQEAERTLKQTSKRFLIHYRKLTPVVYTSVQDSGVLLTVRYLCRPRERRGTAQALWERILDEFLAAGDIDFAYPTQRVYLNPVEGKPGARAELPSLSSEGDRRSRP
jgi:small-conductance mechanosensitive channel